MRRPWPLLLQLRLRRSWRGNNMSYILEALKKAQAERQIGEMPTIHAPTLAPAPAERSAVSRKPLLLGVGLLGGAVVIMGAMLLRQQPALQPAASAASPAVAAAPQPFPGPVQPAAASPATVADAQLASQPLTGAPPIPAPLPVTAARPAQAARASAPAAASTQLADAAPAPTSAKLVDAKPDVTPQRKSAAREADADKPAAASMAIAAAASAPSALAVPAAAAQDEHIQSLRDLPEPIQRAVPQVTMGGYMYSKNPADRLILIDKVLRKEGDEVAPGLQLEKLMPKAAIFVFRGYRYKVPL